MISGGEAALIGADWLERTSITQATADSSADSLYS
jgi:hypothetical protein